MLHRFQTNLVNDIPFVFRIIYSILVQGRNHGSKVGGTNSVPKTPKAPSPSLDTDGVSDWGMANGEGVSL